jgi:hypothetical protein
MTRATAAIVCAASTAALLVLCAAAAATDAAPSWVATVAAAAAVPWAGALALGDALTPRAALRWGLGLAALAGLSLVLAPPALSDDVFRYLWDARVTRAGLDPYRHAPDAPALAALRDGLWLRVNNPEIPTIYPPVAQAAFVLADLVAHAPASAKALALLAHLATVPLVARLASGPRVAGLAAARRDLAAAPRDGAATPLRAVAAAPRPQAAGAAPWGDARARRVARATLGFALAPLALVESALSGHVDALAGLLVAGAVLALARARPWLAAALAGLASGVKLVGLLLAPPIATRHRGAAALALALAAAPLLVLGRSGGGETTGGLGHYARRWRGNEGAFALVDTGIGAAVEAVGRAQGAPPGRVRLHALAPLLDRARGTALDPRAGLLHAKKQVHDPYEFQAPYVAGLLARGAVALAVLGLGAVLARRRTPALAAARLVLLTALLLSPQLHPWYSLWLLPLELAAGGTAGLVLAAAIPLTYAPLDAWQLARVWRPPSAGVAVAHGLAWATLACELVRARRARPRKD